MNKLERKRINIIKYLCAGFLILATLLLLMFNSGVRILRKISGFVIDPIMIGADATFDAIGNFFGSFGSRMKLKDELAQAREELAQYQNIQSVVDEVKAENERLSALLGEKNNYPDFSYIPAKVIACSVDDYSATFTLNKGSSDGITENMVVISVGGLAGKVIAVSPDMCVMLAVIDSRCGIPALSDASRDMGIVRGISDAGSTSGYCEMTGLPTNAIIKPGDTVITSGMGEVYPKGIVIGTITEVSKGSQNQINSTAKLMPAVDFDHLENVLIIKEASAS